MDEQKMPRRPRRSSTEEQPKNESLVYGKNPVTELLKSGSGVDLRLSFSMCFFPTEEADAPVWALCS